MIDCPWQWNKGKISFKNHGINEFCFRKLNGIYDSMYHKVRAKDTIIITKHMSGSFMLK